MQDTIAAVQNKRNRELVCEKSNLTDCFADANGRKIKCLTIFLRIATILLNICDLIANVLALVYFFTKYKNKLGYFITYIIIILCCHCFQAFHFIHSQNDYTLRFSLRQTLFFVFILPYVRLFQFHFQNRKQINSNLNCLCCINTSHQRISSIIITHSNSNDNNNHNHDDANEENEFRFETKNINDYNYEWYSSILNEFSSFIIRGLCESCVLFALLLIFICIDFDIINNGTAMNNVVFWSLLIKLLIGIKIMSLLHVHHCTSHDIFTDLTSGLSICCDILRQLFVILVIINSVVILFYEFSNSDSVNVNSFNGITFIATNNIYSILLQLYIYPSLIMCLMASVFYVKIIINWVKECMNWLNNRITNLNCVRSCPRLNNNCNWHCCGDAYMTKITHCLKMISIAIFYLVLLPVLFLITFVIIFGTFLFVLEFSIVTIVVGPMITQCAHQNRVRMYTHYRTDIKHRAFCYFMNKLCYHLIHNVKYNSNNKNGRYESFFQEICCINYELTDYCIKNVPSTENEKNNVVNEVTSACEMVKRIEQFEIDCLVMSKNNDKINEFSDFFQQTQSAGMYKQLLISVWRNVYDITQVSINYHCGNDFLQIDSWDNRIEAQQVPSSEILRSNDFKHKCFDLFAILYIVSRINVVFFPIYFVILVCVYFDSFASLAMDARFTNFELFGYCILFLTLVMYFITSILYFYPILPLYWKLQNWIVFDVSQKDGMFQLAFKDANIQVGDRIMESILLHENALKLRPLKQQIILHYLPKDIGHVVCQFLPICDYKPCVDDIDTAQVDNVFAQSNTC